MNKPTPKRPVLVISNISKYKVWVLDLVLYMPGETKDFFEEVHEGQHNDLLARIATELMAPMGDLYNLQEKKVIEIVNFHQWTFSCDESMLHITNEPFEGSILTFQNGIMQWAVGTGGGAVSTAAPLSSNAGVISLPVASATQDGFLSKEKFIEFSASGIRQSSGAPNPDSLWFKPNTGEVFAYDQGSGRWLSAPAVLAFFGTATPESTFLSYHHNVPSSFVPYVSQYSCVLTAVIGRSLGTADINLQFMINEGAPINVLAENQTSVEIDIELAAGDRLAIVCLTDTPYPLVQVTYRLLGV